MVVEVPAGVDDGSSASPNADDILMMLTPMPFHKQSHVGNGFGTDLHDTHLMGTNLTQALMSQVPPRP